ncbi:MAG TPA: type II toxin-antitoxin system VapC family toxin [Vicinamibacterales bacterium]|nr:type II toxin-antitoxin system VapC family toxin [Vicinamibacterales bacterium]
MSGRRSSSIVLDTWALLAYLDGEPAARAVRQALRQSRARRVRLLLCIINYGEALYIIERERGLQEAQRAVGIVDQLPLQVIPADRGLVFDAAHIKARYPVSYSDAFAVALAKRTDSRVMTGDPEFKSVEHEVPIRWL